ncbi:MAG TPA: cobaltochelatase subunit CobN, partial [Stenomitos sp.]
MARLPEDFPAVRVVNLLQLQQQLAIDTYAETVLAHAQVVIVRLIGGQPYWSYGLEVVEEVVRSTGATLIVLPGDERPDPTLLSRSTVALSAVNQVWQYFIEAGQDNYRNLLGFMAAQFLGCDTAYAPPQPVERIGLYRSAEFPQPGAKGAGILFYRAHYLSGNTAAIDALCDALVEVGLAPVPIFVSSLKEPDVQKMLVRYCRSGVDVLLNTTSFSLASLDADAPQVDLWQTLNVPVFQTILSGGSRELWSTSTQGLTPRDMAMNVALPEVDGRIITRAVSFKAVQARNTELQTDVVVYEPERSRIAFVAQLAAKWVQLKHTPIAERKVALILANYPNRDGRIANGVGLDTPASCLAILYALRAAGYTVGELPTTSDALMQCLTAGTTNDAEAIGTRAVRQSLSAAAYQAHFQTLPPTIQVEMEARWGQPDAAEFPIAGVQFGHIFVGIQPARGYDLDPSLNYHAPDLEPPHAYLAFYRWVADVFGANAVVHVGKHGNLEWLPGKSVALSETCYPEAVFGPMPHLYPFIVNDPGEGSQAKRRSQAVILDHLTPPMTRAELYGGLHQIEQLIDEYYEAQTLDPGRVAPLRDRLVQAIRQENLHCDLGFANELSDVDIAQMLTSTDGYLCELKEAQIRDGLHIFGQCPQGQQLRDLALAIARNPSANRLGLTRAIAQDWLLDFDPLTTDLGERLPFTTPSRLTTCRTVGDAVEVLEAHAAQLLEQLLAGVDPVEVGHHTQTELAWVRDRLLPSLYRTHQEMSSLLRGLNAEYIPSGASGAPTRGRPEVLPTGRNFYAVDIR